MCSSDLILRWDALLFKLVSYKLHDRGLPATSHADQYLDDVIIVIKGAHLPQVEFPLVQLGHHLLQKADSGGCPLDKYQKYPPYVLCSEHSIVLSDMKGDREPYSMRQRWGKGVSVAWGPAAGWYHAALGSAGPGPCALDFAPPGICG